MHGSELDDKAVPVLTKSLSILGLPTAKVPNKIVFRSRWSLPNHDPDETISLLSMKKNNPGVEFSKLEQLYENNLLSKYLWEERFSAGDINWRELLVLCNRLVERSATEFDVFLKFSLMADIRINYQLMHRNLRLSAAFLLRCCLTVNKRQLLYI